MSRSYRTYLVRFNCIPSPTYGGTSHMRHRLSAAFTLLVSTIAIPLVACSGNAPGNESSANLPANPAVSLNDAASQRSSWLRPEATAPGLVYVSNYDIFVYKLAGT